MLRTILVVASRTAWLVNDSMSGEDMRLALGAGMVHDTALRVRSGVVPAPGNPLLCAIGAGMGVTIQPGQAAIGGVRGGTQGVYVHTEDAVRTVTLDAGDPAQPRIDVILIRVRDTGYSDSGIDGGIVVVKGSPNASPAVPVYSGTAPLGTGYALCQVRVPAGASAGSGGLTAAGATLTDTRGYTAGSGGLLQVANKAARDALAPYESMPLYQADTDRPMVYEGAQWAPMVRVRQEITNSSPLLVQVNPGASAILASGTLTPGGPCEVELDATVTMITAASVSAYAGFVQLFLNNAVVRSFRWHSQSLNNINHYSPSGMGRAFFPNPVGAIAWKVVLANDAGSAGLMYAMSCDYAIRERA